MELADRLAALNATLNGSSFLCLAMGVAFIRAGRRDLHRKAMTAAFSLSAVFLVSYLSRVALSGTHVYPADAPLRGLYLFTLASHVILAAVVPFFAVRGIWLARRQRFEEHRRLMRIGLPVWAYVSVTGVAIYFLLYGALGRL